MSTSTSSQNTNNNGLDEDKSPSSSSKVKLFDRLQNKISNRNSVTVDTNSSKSSSVKRGLSMMLSKKTSTKLHSEIKKASPTSEGLEELKESRSVKTRSVSIMVPKFSLADKQGISKEVSERARVFQTQMYQRKQKAGTKASFSHLIVKRSTASATSHSLTPRSIAMFM